MVRMLTDNKGGDKDNDIGSGAGSTHDSACDIAVRQVASEIQLANVDYDGDASISHATQAHLHSNQTDVRDHHVHTRRTSGRRSSEGLDRWHNEYDRLKDLTATGKAPVGRMASQCGRELNCGEDQSGTTHNVHDLDTAGQDGSHAGDHHEAIGESDGDEDDDAQP